MLPGVVRRDLTCTDLAKRFQCVFEPHRTLMCAINLNVMQRPMRTPCGHLFCETCIHQCLRRKPTCPICREQVNLLELAPDRNIESIINDLEVKCSAHDEGCSWTGKMGQCFGHYDHCSFALVRCTFKGCKIKMLRKDHSAHESVCKFRLVPCGHSQCRQEVAYCLLQEHMETCRFASVECPLGCGAVGLTQRDLSQHEHHCPNRKSPCPFAKHGCKVECSLSLMPQHLSEDMERHLVLVTKSYTTVEKEVQELRTYKLANDNNGLGHMMLGDKDGDYVEEGFRSTYPPVQCFEMDERFLVSGSRDGLARVWDLQTRVCLHVLYNPCMICSLQFDGDILVTGCSDGKLRVWDMLSEQCLDQLTGHTKEVLSLQFDGTTAVSGSADCTIRIWDISAGICLTVCKGHAEPVVGLWVTETFVLSCSKDPALMLWSRETGVLEHAFQQHSTGVTCMVLHDDTFVISGGADGTIVIWDAWNGESLLELRGHTMAVRCLDFGEIAHGCTIVSGSGDGTVRLWNVSIPTVRHGGDQIELLSSFVVSQNHKYAVLNVHSEGTTLVSACEGGYIAIWRLEWYKIDRPSWRRNQEGEYPDALRPAKRAPYFQEFTFIMRPTSVNWIVDGVELLACASNVDRGAVEGLRIDLSWTLPGCL